MRLSLMVTVSRQISKYTSVQVNCKDNYSKEHVFLDHSDSCHIVNLFVPELARTHAYSLTFVLSGDDLDQELVPWVHGHIVSHGFLGVLSQVLRQLTDLAFFRVLAIEIRQPFVHHCLDSSARFLLKERFINETSRISTHLPRV